MFCCFLLNLFGLSVKLNQVSQNVQIKKKKENNVNAAE